MITEHRELGQDHLRDRLKPPAPDRHQRPLNYAIVDDIDAILLDEARVPLVLSGQDETSRE
jgi:preprotein translocase subunit SecA